MAYIPDFETMPVIAWPEHLQRLATRVAPMNPEDRAEALRRNFEGIEVKFANLAWRPYFPMSYPVSLVSDLQAAYRQHSIFTVRVDVNYCTDTGKFFADARSIDCGLLHIAPQSDQLNFLIPEVRDIELAKVCISIYGVPAQGPWYKIGFMDLCAKGHLNDASNVACFHLIDHPVFINLQGHFEQVCIQFDEYYKERVQAGQHGFELADLRYMANKLRKELPPDWECDQTKLGVEPSGYGMVL